MKKAVGRALVVGAVAVAIAALVPWTFSDALLRDPVIAQIKAQTGLDTAPLGHATIALLPRPRVTFDDVAIRDKDSAIVVEARSIRGDLRLTSLFRGRVELKSIVLDTPTVFIDLDARPFDRGGAISRALHAKPGSPEAVVADEARLPTIAIRSGLVRLKSMSHEFETLLQDVDADLDWQTIGGPMMLTGNAVWRGEGARFEGVVGTPAALLRGEQSTATLRLHGRALDLDADGSMSGSPRVQFEGAIKADTSSLRQIARMAGVTIPLPGTLGNASIQGDAAVTGANLALTNAKIGLDGNAFNGSLAMHASGGRMAISGTLATDLLNLDAIAADVPPMRGGDGQWSGDVVDLGNLARDELDLRISADRVRLGAVQAEDAAMSVLLKGGRLDLSLAEAQVYKGAVKARAVGMVDESVPNLKITGSFAQVDLGSALQAGFGASWLSGIGSGQFAVQSSGRSPGELIDALEGHAQFSIAQGEINGINIEQALRRVEKRPLLSASDVHYGRTVFDTASATLSIARGIAQMSDGLVAGPGAQIAFGGDVSIADRTLALACVASQTGPTGGAREGGPELSFAVRGSWDEPSVEPDAESLIRHSDAAAPLLGLHRASEGAVEARPEPPDGVAPAIQ
jgi:AsmA protein